MMKKYFLRQEIGMTQIKVTNIILEEFIDMLKDAYNAGADYIDLVAQDGNGQDRLGVLVREEYMNFDRTHPYKDKKVPKMLTKLELEILINNSIN